MIKLARIGIAAAVLATTSLAAVTPAAARDHTGVAVVAGIIGLGLGAAIASDHPHYRETQYYEQAPQVYYGRPQYGYAQPSYGQPSYGYAQPQYGYGGGYADGSGYAQDRGYAYQPDGQRGRYYDQRRGYDARQSDGDRGRSDQRGYDRDDDGDGY